MHIRVREFARVDIRGTLDNGRVRYAYLPFSWSEKSSMCFRRPRGVGQIVISLGTQFCEVRSVQALCERLPAS
jgi:hypothetical protein